MIGSIVNQYTGPQAPDGSVHSISKWCVKHDGGWIHVTREITERGADVRIGPCDGSCKILCDLPHDLEREVIRHFTPTPRAEEPAGIPFPYDPRGEA